MKLRNKKTGEIGELMTENYEFDGFWVRTGGDNYPDYKDINYYSLAELNAEWEDAPDKERKEYWCIDWTGGVNHIIPLDDSHGKYENEKKTIGNYFKTKEEAEKAVEKLKAYKRLRDRGFTLDSFEGAEICDNDYHITFSVRCDRLWLDREHSVDADLNLLFGGEE